MKVLLELPSLPENIAQLEPFVAQLVCDLHLSEEMHGDILTSLTEAVNNAILHGNQADSRKIVRVAMRKKLNILAFVVTDEGTGFDCTGVADPTTAETIMAVGGRGVFLMRALTHTLRYSQNGSRVELHFKIRAPRNLRQSNNA